MKRILNLSIPGYTCPEGNSDGGAYPIYSYRPDYNAFIEKVSEERSIDQIMGFFDLKTFLLGPFPGELFNLCAMTTKPHTTHITYFKKNKANLYDPADVSALIPDQLVGNLKVIKVTDIKSDISVGDIKKHDISKGDIVFLNTNFSKNYRDMKPTKRYYTELPGLSFAAAEYLVNVGVKVVGIDARTIEPLEKSNRGNVSIIDLFNQAGIPVVEDLANLESVTNNLKWAIIGVPVKIHGALGGAARVIGINPDKPDEYLDLSHKVKSYPDTRFDRPHGWELPLPERIEPRDMQNQISRWTRLLPFILEGDDVRTPDGRSQEMYMYFSHASNTHAECAYFDPFNYHQISEDIMLKYKEMPIDRLIGNASILDLSESIGPRQTIDVDLLEKSDADIHKGDVLFVRADINDWYLFGKSIDITPGFTVGAARWLTDKGIKAIVIDFPSVEKSNPPSGIDGMRYTSNDVHYYFHNNDIPVIEKATKLSHIKQKRFSTAILPLPAHNLGGFPVDIFVWEDWK